MDPKDYFEARATKSFTKPRVSRNTVSSTTAHVIKKARRGSAYSNVRTGLRADLGISVRSNWEANVLRILNAYKIKWEFEPQTFYFPIKRGNKAYIPDIYIKNTAEWIEVKGYLDANSIMKLKRFKKYNPVEFAHLTMVVSKYSKAARKFCEDFGVPHVLYYEDLVKEYKPIIPTWEG